MTKLERVIRLVAALSFMGAAMLLVVRKGLPQRAEYSGLSNRIPTRVAPEVGSLAPPFMLRNSSLEPVALEETAGNFTVLSFWATYCAPCRREMRDLQRLYEIQSAELRIIAINLGETSETVVNWMDELELTYEVLLDPLLSVSQLYQIRGVPTTYLLDGSQRIRTIYYGPVSYEQLQSELQRHASRA